MGRNASDLRRARTDGHRHLGAPSRRWREPRHGTPRLTLLGPFVLATALSMFIMISAGLDRRTVILWQAIAVTAWGAVFAALATGVIAAVS